MTRTVVRYQEDAAGGSTLRPPGASVLGPVFRGPVSRVPASLRKRTRSSAGSWGRPAGRACIPRCAGASAVKAEAAHHGAGFMSEIRLSRLGRVLRRPALLPPPSRALRLALGALRDILR